MNNRALNQSSIKIAHHGDNCCSKSTSTGPALPLHTRKDEEPPLHQNICCCVGVVCIVKIMVCLALAAIVYYALGGTMPSSTLNHHPPTQNHYHQATMLSSSPTDYPSISPFSSSPPSQSPHYAATASIAPSPVYENMPVPLMNTSSTTMHVPSINRTPAPSIYM